MSEIALQAVKVRHPLSGWFEQRKHEHIVDTQHRLRERDRRLQQNKHHPQSPNERDRPCGLCPDPLADVIHDVFHVPVAELGAHLTGQKAQYGLRIV